MSSLVLSFPRAVIMPCQMRKARHGLQVRAQSFKDEGRSRNLVDANMKILKERMEEIRVKERLERSCRQDEGWNYAPGNYSYRSKKQAENLSQYIQVLGSAAQIFGVTVLSATALLCLVSLIAHFHLVI